MILYIHLSLSSISYHSSLINEITLLLSVSLLINISLSISVMPTTVCLIMMIVVVLVCGSGSSGRPDVDNVPAFARWLVRTGKWGVISTNSPVFVPQGYIASYADAGTGSPYFYLSTLDPVGMVVPTDSRASLTVTEISFDGCGGQEAQNPSCAKISLSGELLLLPPKSKEAVKAERALFKAHPSFSGFPKMNGTFAVYKLLVDEIFLVNKMAPPRELTVEEYFDA